MENNTQEEKPEVKLAIIKNVSEVIATSTQVYQEITLSADRACIAASKIQAIENDATDAAAEQLCVALKVTFEKIQGKRKAITGPLDGFKDIFMVPENRISTDAAKTNSEFNRLKGLRNKWANAKAEKIAAQQKEITDKKNHDDEIVRLRAAFDKSAFDGNLKLLAELDVRLQTFYGAVTLENYDASLERLSSAGALPVESWKNWFNVPYNEKFITVMEYNTEKNAAMSNATLCYNACNVQYLATATTKVSAWRDKLPAKKTELLNIAETARTNAAAALELSNKLLQKEQEEATQQQSQNNAEIQQQIAANDQQLAEKVEDAVQNNSFTAQVQSQSVATLEGVKKLKTATLTCEDEDLVVTISDLFYSVFINPKYKGIVKRNKDGSVKTDETGRPIYEDWLEKLLQFYADNCEPTVSGIEVKDAVSTIQRAKKTGE